ncbi:hypothetical protein PG985_002335 [Apiospora marii]|uniref:uncharacterized protein n=1 Tax=Apiospora marii TaxID=335849 RepID=UPI00312F0170
MDFTMQGVLRQRRAYQYRLAYAFTSKERFIRIFIPVFIGINTLVYGAWLYTDNKPNFPPRHGRGSSSLSSRASRVIQLLTRWLTPEFMRDNFVLSIRNLRAGRWWTLLTHAISHRGLSHLASNMAAFHTFASIAMRLCDPLKGSAAAGGLAQVLDWRYRQGDGMVLRRGNLQIIKSHQGLGASAITAGLAMAVTVLRPSMLVSSPLLPSMPMPMWVFGLYWFLYDWYELGTVPEDGMLVGHAGHLGGMVFGAVYAGLKLSLAETMGDRTPLLVRFPESGSLVNGFTYDWRTTYRKARRETRRFLASKAKHWVILALVALDVAGILSDIFIALVTCELKIEDRPWVQPTRAALTTFSLVMSCLFLLELLLCLWAEGIRYLSNWFHCFDAFVIVGSFVIDLLEHGVAEEIASLIVILRLWRFVKIANELSVEASEQIEVIQRRVEELEKENAELRRRLGQGRPQQDEEAALS